MPPQRKKDPQEEIATNDRASPYVDPEEAKSTEPKKRKRIRGGAAAEPEGYDTGASYEAVGEGPLDEMPPSTEGELPAVNPDQDIYGEDDPLDEIPDEEPAEEREEPDEDDDAPPRRSRSEETRVAPVEEEDEDDDDSPDATRAGPPVKLKVLAGPDEGKIKRIKGARMVIGRVSDCDFVLKDASVSRRHCELIYSEKGVLLRDLGSGNGTKLNGEKITEKFLQDGDEIAIGKTRFQFVDELGAIKKAREEAEAKEQAAAAAPPEAAKGAEESASAEESEPKPLPSQVATNARIPMPPRNARRQASGWSAAWQGLQPRQRVVVLVMFLVFASLAFALVAIARKPSGPPPPDPKEAKAAEKMQMARLAARGERFDDALKFIDEAEKLKPGIDETDLKSVVSKELEVQKGLDNVRGLMAEGKFSEAREALGKLPEPTEEKRTEERDALQKELHDRELDAMVNGIEAAIAQKDLAQAQLILTKLPGDKQLEWSPKVNALEAELHQEEKVEAHHVAAAREAAKRRTREEREAFVQSAFEAVSRKFHEGEFERAVLECDRVADQYRGDPDIRQRATELKRLIPSFQRNFEDGQRKYKQNALESAVRPLRKARDLYTQIGFPGALGQIIDEELGGSADAAAKQAELRSDLASAAMDYREALRLNPGDTSAKEGLNNLQRKAEDLYLDAYMVRDRDPREAIDKLRTVLAVAPANSSLAEKAQKQLDLLQPH